MPSTRRRFVAGLATAPAVGLATTGGQTDSFSLDWEATSWDALTYEDSTRADGRTVVLSRADRRHLQAIDDDGTLAWRRTLPAGTDWDAVTGTSDGGLVVAGTDPETVRARRLDSERSVLWTWSERSDTSERVDSLEQLGDGRIAVVGNITAPHAAENRLRYLSETGRRELYQTRAGYTTYCTDTADGDLVIGGRGGATRYDSAGERVWDLPGDRTVRALAFQRGVGVTVAGEDREWSLRRMTSGGLTEERWSHAVAGESVTPTGAVRTDDGGALVVGNRQGESGLELAVVAPELETTTTVLAPEPSEVRPQALHTSGAGYVVTGYDTNLYAGTYVGGVSRGGGGVQQTQIPTTTSNPATAESPTPTASSDGPASSPTATGRQSTRTQQRTDGRTTTGGTGPGFGLPAGVAGLAGAAALVRKLVGQDR